MIAESPECLKVDTTEINSSGQQNRPIRLRLWIKQLVNVCNVADEVM